MNREYSEETESILKSLTLEEKIRIIHGCGLFRTGEIKSKGIPSLVFSDGPMGVRQEFPDDSWTPVGNSDDYVSYCPSNTAIAASWNPQIAETCGEVLGEEARARGKDVILAPGVNIQRTPLCGRNFEYMEKLTDYICRMGHRKIAYIHGQSSLQVVQSRLEGFFRTLGRYGITLPDGYLQEGSFLDAELAAQKTRELLNRKDRPTCILFPDDMVLYFD